MKKTVPIIIIQVEVLPKTQPQIAEIYDFDGRPENYEGQIGHIVEMFHQSEKGPWEIHVATYTQNFRPEKVFVEGSNFKILHHKKSQNESLVFEEWIHTPHYQVSFNLEDGVRLRQLMFSHEEHTWFFTKTVWSEALRLDVENKWVVEVCTGVITKLTYYIRCTFPDKMGLEIIAGLDVSPGAKKNWDFTYLPNEDGWLILTELGTGARGFDVETIEGLTVAKDAPFNIPDRFIGPDLELPLIHEITQAGFNTKNIELDKSIIRG